MEIITKKNIKSMRYVTLGLLAFVAVLFATTLVAASGYQLYCLQKGEILDLAKLCNPAMPKKTGPINICMHQLDNGKNCPTILNVCNGMGLKCAPRNGSSIDHAIPIFNVTSPKNNTIVGTRSALVSLKSNEKVNVYVMDNKNVRVGWKQVCQGCIEYTKQMSFNEGVNDLTYKATDLSGNSAFVSRYFFVDSQLPVISTTLPASGFASGVFNVTFIEANPKSLVLNYGNTAKGIKQANVLLKNCTNLAGGKSSCEIKVDLSTYNGQTINYWFDLTDISNKKVSSKTLSLKVDSSAPQFNSVNYAADKSKITIKAKINEPFFKSLDFIDLKDTNKKWATLCSALVSGNCEKQVTFKDGVHNLSLRATDQAGSFSYTTLSFFVDSIAPKILKTGPLKGFASGTFMIVFQEINPTKLTLHYGNSQTGQKTLAVPLSTCTILKDQYTCGSTVSLSSYTGQQLEYWYELEDRVGNKVQSKHVFLTVDTQSPVITAVNYTLVSTTANFKIGVVEQNLDSVSFLNANDRTPKEKKLCTSLKGGICSSSQKLNVGTNAIDIIVRDKAGNSVIKKLTLQVSR